MGNKKRHIAVIMPSLNEEQRISRAINNTLDAFGDYRIDGEIIVINDGSTDGTIDIVRNEIVRHGDKIRIIDHKIPLGIGASFWDGVDNTEADIVVMIPGDNENDPWEIFRYHRLLEHVDIVIPFVFNKEKRPLFRNALSFIYRFIINTTFLVNFNYTNGTVVYRKSILKDLDYKSKGFFFQTDILVRLVKKGYLFAEVPYKINIRERGVSKAISFPSLMQVIKGYLTLVRDYYLGGGHKTKRGFFEGSQTALRRRGN